MSTVYVKCVDDRRAQGTLVAGDMYEYVDQRMAVSKDHVTRHEYKIVNAVGGVKWYAADRFDVTSESGIEAAFAEAKIVTDVKSEVKKESVKMAASTTGSKKMTLGSFLSSQGVPTDLIHDLAEFRKEHDVHETMQDRLVRKPSAMYMGGSVWTKCIAAILRGHNILLEGEKATGKNILAENLAFAFGRPMWDVSMHTNIDASSLIGSETFRDGQVVFRPGSVYNMALYGGFAVLDEINMAKTDALAVLHAVLDDRGVIDVPGYDRIRLNPASRFIATMNYGYVGTRELNEALVSRFDVISVEPLSDKGMQDLLRTKFPDLTDNVKYFSKLFNDIQAKAKNGEVSTRCVDLRGIINALDLIDAGVTPLDAVKTCVVNKAFDDFERTKVFDIVKTLVPDMWMRKDIFKTEGASDEVTVDFSAVR